MTIDEAITNLRGLPAGAQITVLKVTAKTGPRTTKLDYSQSRNKKLGLE